MGGVPYSSVTHTVKQLLREFQTRFVACDIVFESCTFKRQKNNPLTYIKYPV